MSRPLRLLQVEDSESDAALILRNLERGGYGVDSQRVETADEMRAALAQRTWDVIISDYRLPEFSAPAALAVLQATGADIPFLVVSGTIGEDLAVALMKAGAHDYLMKDGLTRLVPAVEREIREAMRRSQQREAEAALRDSSLLNQQIVASASEGIIVYDRNLHYRIWNGFMERLTGVSAEKVIGRHPADVFPALKNSGSIERLECALAGEVVQSPDFVIEIGAGGSESWCMETSSPLRDIAGQIIGVIRIVHDLTERKRLQDQVNQAHKMEAIGRLAGGIAHDFNNLLTVINGYSELLLTRLPDGDPSQGPISEIRRSGERAAGLTQQLLAFSRKQIVEPKPIDLNQLVAEMRNMLHRIIGEDIRFEVRLDAGPGQIFADAGQMSQVLMNLAVNARDAMPTGGTLSVETANIDLLENDTAAARAGSYVQLTVADTGVGIDAATMERIFEPFFTTKAEGKGTGLGLSTVYGIVEQCGGWIEVDSAPGRGAAFRVFLPRLQGDVGTPETARRRPAELRGVETILLVEDQDEVRRFVAEVLRNYGYNILETSQPGEALLVAERHEGPIDLLLSDVVMPHLTGIELAQRLRLCRPRLRVLYMTGHADRTTLTCGLLKTGGALIRKPFDAASLAAKIFETLHGWDHNPVESFDGDGSAI